MHCVVLCVWLLSLSIMFIRSTHGVVCMRIAFLFTAEYYSTERIGHTLFIWSSLGRHLGCVHLLAVACRAAVNIHVHVFIRVPVSHSLGYIPRGGIAGSPPDFLKAGTIEAHDGRYLSRASSVPDHRAVRRVGGCSRQPQGWKFPEGRLWFSTALQV